MKTFLTLIVLAVSVSAQVVDPMQELRTLDGKVYRQVKVTRVSPTEIRIMHADGLAAIPLSNLPPEVLALYGGKADPKAEQAAEMKRRADNAAAYSQGQSTLKRMAEEKAAAAEVERAAAERAAAAANEVQVAEAQARAAMALAQAAQTQSDQAAREAAAAARQERRNEQQMANGRAANRAGIEQTLQQAILTRRLVLITFNDGAEGARLIEPHMLGVTVEGNVALQAWFVEGTTTVGQGAGWRIYRLDGITAASATDRFFNGPRPGYDPNGGLTFQSVGTRL